MSRFFSSAISAFVTLFAIALLTFVLMKLVPGGPFDGDKALPPEIMASLNAKFHLDLPPYQQFFLYLKGIFLHFDFGPSIKFIGRSVTEVVSESLPISVELGTYAMIIAILVGIPLGVAAAAYRGSALDFSAMMIAISGVSLPSFLVAAIAIVVFSQKLELLPAALWDSSLHKILPSIVLGLRPAAILARITRSSVLEVLHLDYVRTAKAKGLSPAKVLFIHVLRNAFVPVITVLGPIAATVLTGSFVIEYMFSIPGLANHFIQAVTNRDYPLVMGVTLLYASFLVITNLLVDVVYGIIDPRMRIQK